jgi:hypothetical protein
MDMLTIGLVVRTLMLFGMLCLLVIAGVLAALREKRRASDVESDASANPCPWPVVIRADVATRRTAGRSDGMIRRPLHNGQGARVDAVRAHPWT